VIYDEGEVIKRGTYAASVPRAGPWSRGWCWRVRPQGAMCRNTSCLCKTRKTRRCAI